MSILDDSLTSQCPRDGAGRHPWLPLRRGGLGSTPGQVVVRAHQGGPVAGSIAGLIGGDVGSDLGDQGGFDRQVEQARSLCSRAGGD
jgi:hypothetical protein